MYLHCHTLGCGWSQDDFYNKSYNPLTKIRDDFKWLIKPRLIQFDEEAFEDAYKWTRFPILRIKNKCFSWNWLLIEVIKDLKMAYETKWWTYESWLKDKDSAVCPKCGKRNFDID